MKYSLIKNPNWLYEATCLGNELYDFDSEEDIKNLHISSESNKYSMPIEELDLQYKDILNFRKNCLLDAFKLFRLDSEFKVFTSFFPGEFAQMSLLESIMSSSMRNDVELISSEEFLKTLMLSIYVDFLNSNEDDESLPKAREYFYNNSTWDEGNIGIEMEDVLTILESTRYTEEMNWAIVNLIFKEEKRKAFLEKMISLQNIIKKHFHLVKPRYESALKKYEENPTQFETIGRLLGGFMENFENINVAIQCFRYNAVSFRSIEVDEIKDTCYTGIIITELMDLSGYFDIKDENVIERCKAIGDTTRFAILNHLSDRPMYVKELADLLDLSSATLSHHLSILLKNRFLEVSIEDRRAYYSLNKEGFEELGNYFQMKANTMRKKHGN